MSNMTHKERNQLLEQNINYIHYFLKKYFSKFRSSHDDLFNEACLACLEVLPDYSTEKGAITTFLAPYIRSSASKYIVHNIYHTTTHYYRAIAKILKYFPDLDDSSQMESVDFIAQRTNLPKKTVENALQHFINKESVNTIAVDTLLSVEDNAVSSVLDKEFYNTLYHALNQFNPIDQRILKYHLGLSGFPKYSIKKIAEQFNHSYSYMKIHIQEILQLLSQDHTLSAYIRY